MRGQLTQAQGEHDGAAGANSRSLATVGVARRPAWHAEPAATDGLPAGALDDSAAGLRDEELAAGLSASAAGLNASVGLRDDELAALSAGFERQPASAVIAWAVEQFHPRLCLAASMTDAVLIDLAVAVEPSIEVVFIDTGYHFPETLETVEAVRRRYGINLRVMTVPPSPVPLWQSDPELCCSAAKVEQLETALAGKLAWMSGLRRDEATTRAEVPIVGRDRRGLVKVSPLATWSDLDVAGYIADHDVPVNPLLSRGYLSIGCAPCTRPVAFGEHPRAGRWPGREKTECGLHE